MGPDHIDLIVSNGLLAFLLEEDGQLEESEQVFRQVVDLVDRTMDPQHGMRGEYRSRFGSFLLRKGDLDDAESTLLEAYEVLCLSFGPDSPHAQRTANELAKLYELRIAANSSVSEETVELWKQRSSEYRDPDESGE